MPLTFLCLVLAVVLNSASIAATSPEDASFGSSLRGFYYKIHDFIFPSSDQESNERVKRLQDDPIPLRIMTFTITKYTAPSRSTRDKDKVIARVSSYHKIKCSLMNKVVFDTYSGVKTGAGQINLSSCAFYTVTVHS